MAIFDCIIWYPAPSGSFSGLRKVNIRAFWYGFRKDIAIGYKAIKTNEEYAKNFTLTPASQATTKPPAAINNDVPRSGCIITKRTGKIKTNIGRNKNLNLLILSIGIRW